MEKPIKFYKYEIIIENDIELSFLDGLEDSNIEPLVIGGEIIQVDDFSKFRFSERFYGLYFQSGDLYNYSRNVIDTKNNLAKKKNPRKSTDIEFDKQFFFLIDRANRHIYLSDNKQKTYIAKWISEKTGNICRLKVILDEEKFKNSLQQVSEINFAFKNENTLFSNSPLDKELLKDLYSYDADSINISFKYNKSINQKIRDKIDYLLREKEKYKNIQVVGKDDKNIDLIFNSRGIMSRIILDEELDEKTKKFIPSNVFNNLIIKVKTYEV